MLACVTVKIISNIMAGMCCNQNHNFQDVRNVLGSKLSVSACLVCAIVKTISFIMSGTCRGKNGQFQHIWNVSRPGQY
jgi:hypothetical protein